MAIRDLLKNWDEALVSALSARQPELSDSDLEVTAGLEVRSNVLAGRNTEQSTCGCGTILCSITQC